MSPANFIGPLALGGHRFVVRAVDLAGNRGEPARFAWTIEAGEGPRAVIREGPDELTNETRADFRIEAEDAVSLECSLDDGEFGSCPTLVSFDVEEGEHTLTARALNAAGNAGPPASYDWTVDTTPPTVEIQSLELTEPTTAVIAFEPSEQVSLLDCSLLTRATQDAPAPQPECVSPIEYAGLQESSTYVFEVVATDLAGNVGEPAREEFETQSDDVVDR